MFWKRQVPIAIVFTVGVFTLLGWFVGSYEILLERLVSDRPRQVLEQIAREIEVPLDSLLVRPIEDGEIAIGSETFPNLAGALEYHDAHPEQDTVRFRHFVLVRTARSGNFERLRGRFDPAVVVLSLEEDKTNPVSHFIQDDATQWYDIIASFAIILGALNLLKLQGLKVLRRRKDWQYSVTAILGFAFAFFAGFLFRGANYVSITDVGASPARVAEVVARVERVPAEEVLPALKILEKGKMRRVGGVRLTSAAARSLADELEAAGASVQVKTEEWGAHLLAQGSLFKWMFDYVFTPLSATMFALLAFFVASASYRAFRIRNFEATLLLGAGIILMLGRVPIGSTISGWFVAYILVLGLGILVNTLAKNRTATLLTVVAGLGLVTLGGIATGWPVDRPAFLFLPALQEWIYLYPNVAGTRAIMIGIALGMVGTSLRVILGIEKSFMGER
ncbi:MAG: hypothetical protein ACE5LH_07245 [Fidelibacterota bacterium]